MSGDNTYFVLFINFIMRNLLSLWIRSIRRTGYQRYIWLYDTMWFEKQIFPLYKIAFQNISKVLNFKFLCRNALTVNLFLLMTGHRLWLCKKSKRKNLDVMWDSRIPGTWNNSQQGTLSCYSAMHLMQLKLITF